MDEYFSNSIIANDERLLQLFPVRLDKVVIDNDWIPSFRIIISKENRNAIRLIRDAAAASVIEAFGLDIPDYLECPLRDGDRDFPMDENYFNTFYVDCVVGPNTEWRVYEDAIGTDLDDDLIYSGCYCSIRVAFLTFRSAQKAKIRSIAGLVTKMQEGDWIIPEEPEEYEF